MDELLQDERKFVPEDLKDMLFSHRHFGAELYLDDVLTVCELGAPSTAASCEVLSKWDRTSDVDSVGTHIWTGFWEQARQVPGLFADAFDENDPVNTPSRLAVRASVWHKPHAASG